MLLGMAHVHRVILILDEKFVGSIDELAANARVWLVESPANGPSIADYREKHPEPDRIPDPSEIEKGLSTFKPVDISSDDELSELFEQIDLKHGDYSTEDAWTDLEVINAPGAIRTGAATTATTLALELSPDTKTLLMAYGFEHFEPTALGFTAKKS